MRLHVLLDHIPRGYLKWYYINMVLWPCDVFMAKFLVFRHRIVVFPLLYYFFLFISLINVQFCNRSFLLARSILPFTLGNISCAFTCINVLVCMWEAEFNAFWKLLSTEELRFTRDVFLLDLELGDCWASACTGCYVIRCRRWCTALCDVILYLHIKLVKEHKNNLHCLLGMICLDSLFL